MTHDVAGTVSMRVLACTGCSCDNGTRSILLDKLIPDSPNIVVFVLQVLPRGSSEGSDTQLSLATFDMTVVTMVLSKCSLKDGHPQGFVWARLSQVALLPAILDRDVIVNDNSVRNTQGMETDAIDAS